MEAIKVHSRVHARHKEIADAEVLSAWRNAIALVERRTEEKDFSVAIGFDEKGRLIEMVASRDEDGMLLVLHAMTPPTKKALEELGLMGRK